MGVGNLCGHSHSKGDTTIYFEEEEVLVAGDLLYTEVHSVTFFGDIPNWADRPEAVL
jgi:glyoxylase-like metal-dependent hydrolase (beta-lactamase superfamily II)